MAQRDLIRQRSQTMMGNPRPPHHVLKKTRLPNTHLDKTWYLIKPCLIEHIAIKKKDIIIAICGGQIFPFLTLLFLFISSHICSEYHKLVQLYTMDLLLSMIELWFSLLRHEYFIFFLNVLTFFRHKLRNVLTMFQAKSTTELS